MIVTNHLIKKLSFTLFAVFISNGAFAEWKLVSSNFNNYIAKNGSEISKKFDYTYVDYATIRKEGNMVKMWSLTNFGYEREISSGITYLSMKSLKEFDCKEEQVRYLYALAYSKNTGDGEPIYIEDTPSLQWSSVPPQTVIKKLWKIACGQTEEDKIKSEKSKIDFILYKGMLKYSLDPDAPPPQEEWIEIKPFRKSEYEKYYFHPIIYKKNSRLIQVWQLNRITPASPSYPLTKDLIKKEYDCENKRYRYLYSFNHVFLSDKPIIIPVIDKPGDNWSSVKSGFFEDYIIDIVCDKRG